MKIQPSDILRFLYLARKYLKSTVEDDCQTVVFTSTEDTIAIAMPRDGLLLTYLCSRVESETCEQTIGVPIRLLHDSSNGTGTVELHEVVVNGDSHVAAHWSDGQVQYERTYPAQDPHEFHMIPDLAWHTIDERLVEL